jgi:spore maturation protein SpmB
MPLSIATLLLRLASEAWLASRPLIRITIPVVILIKLLQEFQLIQLVHGVLAPVMEVVGLPPDSGVVWAAALFGNLYSSILVFLSVAPQLGLTEAQATVLLTMVLVAHSLPMELKVTQMVGVRMSYMAALRCLGAVALGWTLTALYGALGVLQQPVRLLAAPAPRDQGWLDWAMGELRNLVMIYLIVLALTALLAFLRWVRLDRWLEAMLSPLSRLLGTNPRMGSFTVIGMLAGISYGGALMLRELERHPFTARDIAVTITLMGLAHGLVEETLLMLVLKADLSGILVGRLLLGLACALVVSRLLAAPRPALSRLMVTSTPAAN